MRVGVGGVVEYVCQKAAVCGEEYFVEIAASVDLYLCYGVILHILMIFIN